MDKASSNMILLKSEPKFSFFKTSVEQTI